MRRTAPYDQIDSRNRGCDRITFSPAAILMLQGTYSYLGIAVTNHKLISQSAFQCLVQSRLPHLSPPSYPPPGDGVVLCTDLTCGTFADPYASCWCDSACTFGNDCCPNYTYQCAQDHPPPDVISDSCAVGGCGNELWTCWYVYNKSFELQLMASVVIQVAS